MQLEHDRYTRDNLSNVPDERVCGAKTRAGTTCKNWGMRPSGRCRMHGGKSHGGIASPTLKHGWYSRYFPYSFIRKEAERRERAERHADACRVEIRAQRATQEARESAEADRLRTPAGTRRRRLPARLMHERRRCGSRRQGWSSMSRKDVSSCDDEHEVEVRAKNTPCTVEYPHGRQENQCGCPMRLPHDQQGTACWSRTPSLRPMPDAVFTSASMSCQ